MHLDVSENQIVHGEVIFTIDAINVGSPSTMRVDKASLVSITIAKGSASEEPLRQTMWGVGYMAAGGLVFYHASGLTQWVSIPLIGLGLFVLRHVIRTVTVVKLTKQETSGVIPLGALLTKEERQQLIRQLKSWGYPISK